MSTLEIRPRQLQQAISVLCPCLFIVVCQSQKKKYISLSIFMPSKIVWFSALVTSRVGTHISYLFGSGACQQSVLEGADCGHCEKLSARTLRSRRAFFRGGRFGSRFPRGSLCCRGTETTRISGFANGSDSGGWDELSSISAFT